MTLSPLDDLPVHQIAQPMLHVGSSDRNFYDRYYFCGHPCSDEIFFVFGMGQYPNLSVQDGFLAVLYDGRYRVVRASRRLGDDRTDTTVGPLRVEVLEGLRRLRVVVEPNEWGIEADLTWEGSVPAHQEPQHVIRSHGRLVFDSCRLAQVGSWSGRLVVDDAVFDVVPERWWGARDRSWGIRPVGEAEPPGIRAGDEPQFWWIYAPIRFEDGALYFIVQERPDGSRILESAVRSQPFADGGEPESLGSPGYDLECEAGTRNVWQARLRALTASGEPVEVTATPLLRMHIGIGAGYGFDPDWRHGMYQGELVVQGVSWDLRTEEGRAAMWGIVDSVARFERSDGAIGFGLLEYLLLGPHERFGLKGFDDGFAGNKPGE